MASDPDTSLQPDQPEQSDDAQADRRVVNTQGGDYAEGDINKRQSTIVEGDQFDMSGDFRGANVYAKSTIITEERAYNVAGLLPNPYLGLRAFTAAERDIFAGRERMVRALVERLSAEDGDRLLFIIGASGSGKSSLARAGLLPDLADRLCTEGYDVQTRVIDHPGRLPGTALARLLKDIHTAPSASSPRIHLILIDQAEELFSHADPTERDQALSLLADVAANVELSVRIIAAMRSDFLPQLVADSHFEVAERRMVVVRTMSEDELQDAIQRPIQVRYPEQRLEPALVQRLVQDAATDVAYLPLLQVTLEDLWRGGELRLGAYRGLADAIQRRADAVYTFRDYDELQQEKRTSEEQQIILNLFLALVRASLAEEQHVVRWRRPLSELTQADPQRARLIADLATARLLRTDREVIREDGHEREVETVDIVHDALMSGWPTLIGAIERERELLRRRERFVLALTEWLAHKQHDDYLLTGVRLAEAEALKQRNDGVSQREGAQEFFTRSIRRRDEERQRQVRRARMVAAGLSLLALLALLAASVAGWFGIQAGEREAEARNNAATAMAEQRRADSQAATAVAAQQNAELQARVSKSGQISLQARLLAKDRPDLALLLSLEAIRLQDSVDSRGSLVSVLDNSSFIYSFISKHPGAVYAVAISQDGLLVASAGDDAEIFIWSVQDGKLLGVLKGHEQRISSLAFSPDSKILASSSCIHYSSTDSCDQGDIRMWDVTKLTSLGPPLTGYEGGIKALAFSPDGKLLASGGCANLFEELPSIACDKGEVRIWDIAKMEIVGNSLVGHTSWVFGIAFSNDGRFLASGSWDSTVIIWDIVNHRRLTDEITVSRTSAQSPIFSSDNTKILSEEGNDIYFIDIQHGIKEKIVTLDGSSPTTSFSMALDGQTLAIGRDDGTVTLVNMETKEFVGKPLTGHPISVSALSLGKDGQKLVVGSLDGTVVLWNLRTGANLSTTFKDGTLSIQHVSSSQDGKLLALAYANGTIEVWSLQEKSLVFSSSEQYQDVKDIDFDLDNRILLIINGYKIVRIDVQQNQTSYIGFEGFMSYMLSASFNNDRKIAVISEGARVSGGVILVDTASGERIAEPFYGHDSEVSVSAVSPDGNTLIDGSYDSTVIFWDVKSGKRLTEQLREHKMIVTALAFSPDGRIVASGSRDTTIRIWDVATRKPIDAPLLGHTSGVTQLVFSPDGSILASSDDQGRIILWDVETWQRLVAFSERHFSSVNTLLFSADGNILISGGSDGQLIFWDVNMQSWKEKACRAIGRNFTNEEWHQYFDDQPYHLTCPNFPDGEGVTIGGG